MNTKICTNPECHKAGEEQKMKFFYVDRSSDDGRTTRCVHCIAEYNNARTKNEGGEWPIPSESTMMLAINASRFDPATLGDLVNVYVEAGRMGAIQ